ncbi:MAG TPA: cyclopropane-fatty-acyl-phospholipid synthase family protein [Aliidongia sp.]|uniref:cyclopropane-fatty-acyl-phospholipid synthase family protein n=1 Tax=Aliidongia sp. TaxID=1914230 RepID=UPI002DDDAD62|nr:cyclopropane-fatty-acyl-phospholipid synthase family protein [Aliidongia sp.]HEV2678644.1 cyclopropane-fatty-acyl-phospholipid synthase family protein [Aliidongia sp.]
MLLAHLLRHLVRRGRLTVIDASGRSHYFGELPGPISTIRLHTKAFERRMFFNPRMAVGEGYMDGLLTIEQGDIYDFLSLVMGNISTAPRSATFTPLYQGVDRWWRWLQQYNPVGRAQENVAHHYDLSATLYDLFLDADRQYSCAYFEHPTDDLETAQANKKRHIASKLLLKPGQKVLDIGSGWGGLGLYLAQETGADVTGLTLSTEQHKLSNDRVAAAGLDDRVRFEIQDYRLNQGRYDRIVSVGMFEHVGVNHYGEYFNKIADLLADDGVALIHAIGRQEGPGTTNPWVRKYIFPGGYCPALSEVLPAVERAGLQLMDVEILRLHYAETLRHWRQRFLAHWDQVKALYDERFCRMWEFYLAASEAGFRVQDLMVFQIQIAKRVDAVPMTRDYMAEWKAEHPLHTASPGRKVAAGD